MQERYGRRPHHDAIAYREVHKNLAATAARWRRRAVLRWPGRIGGGGEHLGAGVARIQWPTGRAVEIAQGAATDGGADSSARTTVWTPFELIL